MTKKKKKKSYENALISNSQSYGSWMSGNMSKKAVQNQIISIQINI